VWQNKIVHTYVKEIQNFSNFLEKDYNMLSQYLEHVLFAPQGKRLIEDANKALKRIDNVAVGIYPATSNKF
jgi:thiaminase